MQIKYTVLVVVLFASLNSFAQAPNVSFSSSGKCVDQTISFTDGSTTAVGTLDRWHWDFGINNVTSDTSNLQNPDFVYTSPGTYQVKLKVWNSLGEVDSSFEFLSIFPSPDAKIQSSVPCFPNTASFTDASTVNPGFIQTRLWNAEGASSTASTFNHAFSAIGSYRVSLAVVTDDGCIDTVSTVVFQGNQPIISFTPNSIELCEGDSSTVLASGANTYLWANGDTTAQTTVSSGGFHAVTGFNGNQCFTEDSVNVKILVRPAANAGNDVTIALGESTTLMGTGDGNFSWSPPDDLSDPNIANPIASPGETTEYILTVIGNNGCFSMDTIIVTVDATSGIPIHNLITPNSDGSNDVWDLSNVPNLAMAEVKVFNRWGWEVFKTDDYQNNWRGTHNGEPLADGVYIYVINFKDGSRDALSGTIQLLRNSSK